MNRHLLFATLLAVVTIVAALLAGPFRRGALIGATTSSITGLVSVLLMGQSARSRSPVQTALLVMVGMFLVRIVVVAVSTVAVARASAGIFAFLIAFFVPYFLFAAIEGMYLRSLPSGTGPAR